MLQKKVYWNIYSAEEMKIFEKYAQQEDYHWECSESVFMAHDSLTKHIPFCFRLDNIKKTITWEEKIYFSGGRMPGIYIVNERQESEYLCFEKADCVEETIKKSTKAILPKVGDIIDIEEGDSDFLYSYYFKWFKKNKIDLDIAARYAYTEQELPVGAYEIIAIGKNDFETKAIYAITPTNRFDGLVFLISEDCITE